MVYLHFPSNLTEEEMMLQAKYQKLKRKKKVAVKQKAPRPEPERSPVKVSRGPKMEARDAREVAKKLIKSGAIGPIVKTPKRAESEGFKRPSRFRGLERKMIEEKTVAGYQPFASSPADEREEVPKPSFIPKVKNLYDNFVSEKALESSVNETDKADTSRTEKPKQGHTIFVSGYKISEDFLRRSFSTYGVIIDVSMESEKKGFVTFKKPDASEKAISEMDGKLINGGTLKVTLARKQKISPAAEPPCPGDWCGIATKFQQKGTYVDKREAVCYGDDFLS